MKLLLELLFGFSWTLPLGVHQDTLKLRDIKTSKVIHSGIIQAQFIPHGPHICEFAYSLKCICNSQITTVIAFMVIHGHEQNGKNFVTSYTPFQFRLNKVELYFQSSSHKRILWTI